MLSEDQGKALENIIYEIAAGNREQALLGCAGTGKTYLVKHIVAHAEDMGFDVMLAAPTNKAAQVLYGKTGQLVTTVHKLFGLVLEEKEGESKVKKVKAIGIDSKTLIVIDECSMVGEDLYLEICRVRDTFKHVYFLYVGDPYQLNPVNEEDSRTLCFKTYELTQVMRQAEGSGVLDLAIAIRDAQDETARGSNKRMNVRGFASTEVLITQDRRKFEFSYLNRIKFESPDYCRAVAWTNSRVQELNTAARLKLFGAGAQPFYFGESLTLHAPYIVGQDRRVMLPNGYEGGITDIGADSVFVLPGTNSELRVKNLAIDGVWMMVAMDINERVSAFNACAIWAREQKIKTGHSAAWGEFYEAKNAVVDARHCYAVTSHKAQGSTYDTVYVDWANIAKNNSGLERLRSLYVAVTRASNKVFILDSRI